MCLTLLECTDTAMVPHRVHIDHAAGSMPAHLLQCIVWHHRSGPALKRSYSQSATCTAQTVSTSFGDRQPAHLLRIPARMNSSDGGSGCQPVLQPRSKRN